MRGFHILRTCVRRTQNVVVGCAISVLFELFFVPKHFFVYDICVRLVYTTITFVLYQIILCCLCSLFSGLVLRLENFEFEVTSNFFESILKVVPVLIFFFLVTSYKRYLYKHLFLMLFIFLPTPRLHYKLFLLQKRCFLFIYSNLK